MHKHHKDNFITALGMSSLIPERPLVISPSLAATIGLEEAVMLQVLNDACQLSQGQQRRGNLWFVISLATLQQQLPFWNNQDLQRVSKNLKDKGIILIESPPLPQSQQLVFAMNEAKQAASTQRATANPRPPASANLLAENWCPEEDLLQLLALNHGIPREFALRQLEDFILYWRDRQQVSHSWPSKFRQHVLKEWRFHQSREAAAQAQIETDQNLNQQWQPSEDALEILYRAGVNHEFIEDAVPEFVLYWSERGEASTTWNSKFIAHIRRQWAKYTQALQHDYEPRPIPANWQPSEDVYDILQLANIDLEFARQQIPEFVLFWRDTGQIQRSWNTKFLQHVKYLWASRHHFSTQRPNALNAGNNLPTGELRNSPFKQLTDRSWAEGIVDGLEDT